MTRDFVLSERGYRREVNLCSPNFREIPTFRNITPYEDQNVLSNSHRDCDILTENAIQRAKLPDPQGYVQRVVLLFRSEVPSLQSPESPIGNRFHEASVIKHVYFRLKLRLGIYMADPGSFWIKVPNVNGKVVAPISVMAYIDEGTDVTEETMSLILKDLELLGGLKWTQDHQPKTEHSAAEVA
ncbi:hypothetical protein BDW69DRAFT_184427 [Aspergillus filifer]